MLSNLAGAKAYMTCMKHFTVFLLTDAWPKWHLASSAERHQNSSSFFDRESGYKTLSVTCKMHTNKFGTPFSI